MTSSIIDTASTALSGILKSEKRIAADASGIATGGTAGTPAPPLTGGQPGNAAGGVLQALQGGGDLLSPVVDLIGAKASYKANAQVLRVSSELTRKALDVIS